MAETIPQLLREGVLQFGEKPALVSPVAPPMAFRALDALADRFAKALVADGIGWGGRVCVWAPNLYEWIAAAVGAQRVGGTLIPVYFRYRGAEVAEILRRARARWVICTRELAQQLQGEELPGLKRAIVLDGQSGAGTGCEIAWEDFLRLAEPVSNETLQSLEKRVNGDTVSDIMYTSGTTGRPKGAVFSHRSSVAAALIMQDYNGADGTDCICPMGSFAHVGGYKQGWVTGLASGASIAWGDAFDPVSVLGLVSRLGITVMPAAPITWQGVLDYGNRADFDISRLRFAATGGTMIPPELVIRLNAELDVRQVGTGYGMTETCGMDAYTRPDDPVDKITSTVGRPAPDTELRIVDGSGCDVRTGEHGEILIRNPRLLIEYLEDADATRAALEDGWFRSGDVGSLDPEGYLTITDRLKDMYIINGLNVYPAEIERWLEAVPGVQQCAVVGLPKAVKGEVGAAFIVRHPGSALSEADVRDWCGRNLASYKIPKFITFIDDLPRNAMGKVLKNELRRISVEV